MWNATGNAFFILISINFSLAANVAANVNFYKMLKNQLLMYSYMWNASSNTFFILNSINFSLAANVAATRKFDQNVEI